MGDAQMYQPPSEQPSQPNQGAYQPPPGQPGYGPPPGYSQPVYPQSGYAPPVQVVMQAGPKTNGLAVTGMIVGIVGLVLFFTGYLGLILCVLGIVFGGIGLYQVNQAPQQYSPASRGMAITGLVLGVVGIGIAIYFIIAVINAIHALSNSFT
jgi:hypothetical protein